MFPEVAQQLDMTFMAEFYAIEPFFMSNKKKFSRGLSANALGNFPVSSLKNADTAAAQRNTEVRPSLRCSAGLFSGRRSRQVVIGDKNIG